MLRGLKQNLVHTRRCHRDWARPALECLSVSCVGTCRHWPATAAGALGTADLDMPWALLKEVAINPTWSCQNLHRTGETDSWRAQTKPCVHQDPGERSSDPTRDRPRFSGECLGVASGGVGQRWPDAGLGSLSAAVHAWDILKEVTSILITSTILWPQVKQQPCPLRENWIKDLLNMAPPIRTRPDFLLSQSLLTGNFHKSLIIIHQRADRMKTSNTGN